MNKQLPIFFAMMSIASCALAQVTVQDPWIRATVPAAKATGAFMQLRSPHDVRLVEVRSSAAGVAEIHEMAMDGQTMRMHAVSGLDLPAGKAVDLASGSYHVMLMDLKRQLKEGETVALTLVFQKKDKKMETIALDVPVRALTYSAPQAKH